MHFEAIIYLNYKIVSLKKKRKPEPLIWTNEFTPFTFVMIIDLFGGVCF